MEVEREEGDRKQAKLGKYFDSLSTLANRQLSPPNSSHPHVRSLRPRRTQTRRSSCRPTPSLARTSTSSHPFVLFLVRPRSRSDDDGRHRYA
jgi:hypothetical protein